jgi:hypothetical protein
MMILLEEGSDDSGMTFGRLDCCEGSSQEEENGTVRPTSVIEVDNGISKCFVAKLLLQQAILSHEDSSMGTKASD